MNTIFYDEQCGFCSKVVHYLREKIGSDLELRTLQSIGKQDQCFETYDKTTIFSAMWLYDNQCKLLFQGYYAFKEIALVYSRSIILKLIFKTPGVDFIGVIVYKTIARNRRLAGCNSDTCGLHG
jgi:predicted DCC family thiol-disulfide oxidoreductase YuxK